MPKTRKPLKFLIVGDGAVGKTGLLMTYIEGTFPETYIPSAYKACCADITDGHDVYKANIWDTAGGEDFYRLRPLTYPETDVIILCFALDNRNSYENLRTEWAPELKHYLPHTPVILVGKRVHFASIYDLNRKYSSMGTKSDLESRITTEEAKTAQANLKAVVYLTCSSKLGKDIKEIFYEALNAYKNNLKSEKRKCLIL